jgi:hypothetical protein
LTRKWEKSSKIFPLHKNPTQNQTILRPITTLTVSSSHHHLPPPRPAPPHRRRSTFDANNSITMVSNFSTNLCCSSLLFWPRLLNHAAEFRQDGVLHTCPLHFVVVPIFWSDSSVFSVYELQATKKCCSISRKEWIFKLFLQKNEVYRIFLLDPVWINNLFAAYSINSYYNNNKRLCINLNKLWAVFINYGPVWTGLLLCLCETAYANK